MKKIVILVILLALTGCAEMTYTDNQEIQDAPIEEEAPSTDEKAEFYEEMIEELQKKLEDMEKDLEEQNKAIQAAEERAEQAEETELEAEKEVVELEEESKEEEDYVLGTDRIGVVGTDTISEVVTDGENFQVSTIFGNGTQGQGEYTFDHPQFPGIDSKGNIYFLDGYQKTAKLRMFDGEKNRTLIDLMENKIIRRTGYFYTTGLVVINDTVYIASESGVYQYIDEGTPRITQLNKINEYMDDNRYEYIYRMETYGGDIYLMLYRKNYQYGFVKYNIEDKTVEEVLPAKEYPGNPSNFYVDGDGIAVTTIAGVIYYEEFFPRNSKVLAKYSSNDANIYDIWIDENDNYYFAARERGIRDVIHSYEEDYVVGARRGFTDGIADEVEMDYPTDFVWDGTGFIFADRGNHAIRKLWMDTPPSNHLGGAQ